MRNTTILSSAVPSRKGKALSKKRGKWVTLIPFWEVPNTPACYVICDGKTTFYVGQTNNLRKRLCQHQYRARFDGVHTKLGFLPGATIKYRKSERYGDWLMHEARLIRRLKPIRNKQLVTPYVGTETAQCPTGRFYAKQREYAVSLRSASGIDLRKA